METQRIQLPETPAFVGATVILPAVTETDSIDETATILKESSDADIAQVLVVVCDRTTSETMARCEGLRSWFGERVQIHHQRLPFLGGAMREAFDLATASHVIMMATDLETDPRLVPAMIDIAKQRPSVVVTASRWARGEASPATAGSASPPTGCSSAWPRCCTGRPSPTPPSGTGSSLPQWSSRSIGRGPGTSSCSRRC